MKKKDLAQVQAFAMRAEKLMSHASEQIAEQIASNVSTLVNIDPGFALDVLEQLNEQKPMMEQALKERTEKDKGLVEELVKRMPPMIEFDEDDEDESDLS